MQAPKCMLRFASNTNTVNGKWGAAENAWSRQCLFEFLYLITAYLVYKCAAHDVLLHYCCCSLHVYYWQWVNKFRTYLELDACGALSKTCSLGVPRSKWNSIHIHTHAQIQCNTCTNSSGVSLPVQINIFCWFTCWWISLLVARSVG